MSAQTRTCKLWNLSDERPTRGERTFPKGSEPLEELERFAPARSTVDVPLGPQLLLVFVEDPKRDESDPAWRGGARSPQPSFQSSSMAQPPEGYASSARRLVTKALGFLGSAGSIRQESRVPADLYGSRRMSLTLSVKSPGTASLLNLSILNSTRSQARS